MFFSSHRLPPWPFFLGGIGLGVAGLYLAFREVEPRSMPVVLPNTVEAFVAVMRGVVEAVVPTAPLTVKNMIIAHAAYESGWGKASGWRKANNPFNLTTISGPFVNGPDLEYAADGSVKKIVQKWALFASLEDGLRGYFTFIQRQRYTNAYKKLMAGDITFLDDLHKGGYFTLPLPEYKKNYLSVVRRVETTTQKLWLGS